jgi:mRNA interferase MazF
LKWASAPGNILLKKRITGLAKDSVVNVSQVVSLDKSIITERAKPDVDELIRNFMKVLHERPL